MVVAAALSLAYPANAGLSHHLTAGFSRVKLSESQFVVQKPYDVPLHERYEQYRWPTGRPGPARAHAGTAR